MNITDQIITAANSICNYWMAEKARQTNSFIKKKRLKDIYSEWYDEISKEVYESEYASDLLIRDILVYNSYESIAGFLSLCFYQVNTLAEIVFSENTTVDYVYEYDKIPIVRKNYNFSIDNVDGVKATSYLSNLFLLREIRRKLGYDVNLYPEKCYVIAFKFEDVVYVWENGRSRNMRLTIDRSANQEILDVFFEIFYTQTKTYEAIYSLLDDLPFVVGEDAQKEFDVIWYRYKKQTPLTYRCFPNTHTVDFSFKRKICRHKGEYCIQQDKLDSRYNRFIDLYEALDKEEKEDLIINTIDYLEKFIETDCFEKPMHKNMYFVLLCDVKSFTAEFIEMGKTMRACISDALNKNKENGGPLFSIFGLSHLDGWEPKMPFFNSGDEDSPSETHKPQQFGPNWDLINADIEEGKEERRKEQIEIAKIALKEVLEEQNVDMLHQSKKSKKDDQILKTKSKSLSCKQIALIHIYENKEQITRKNASIIAAKYGFISPSSGEGLFQDYNLFSSHANRTGLTDPFTKKKMNNKIGLFNSILQNLTPKAKIQAKKEIQLLERRLTETLEKL